MNVDCLVVREALGEFEGLKRLTATSVGVHRELVGLSCVIVQLDCDCVCTEGAKEESHQRGRGESLHSCDVEKVRVAYGHRLLLR